jgi:hypothetical protein
MEDAGRSDGVEATLHRFSAFEPVMRGSGTR